jgi:hypothetical protein
MNAQLQANWPEPLNGIAYRLNPIHEEIFQRFPIDHCWSTYPSERAADIVFGQAEDLRRLYPCFCNHAITTFRSP